MSAFSIHPKEIFGKAAYPPPSDMDLHVARILKGTAEAQAWSYSELAESSNLNLDDLMSVFEGERPFTAELLYKLCKSLSQDLSAILERAAKLSENSSEVTANKRTAS